MSKGTTTALAPAPAEAGNYPVLGPLAEQKLATLKTNLGRGGLQLGDLDRVTVPSGGNLAWTVPTLKGKKPAETVEGVIVGMREGKAYWARGLEDGGGGSPPDCRSDDGLRGIGNPGGPCKACPYNEFGTAKGGAGAGKACADYRLLFILREGETLPLTVKIPGSSLGPVRKYLIRLAGQGIPYYGVVTSLGLEQVRSGGGITYSQVVPEMLNELTPEQVARAEHYAATIGAVFGPGVTAETEPEAGAETPVAASNGAAPDPNDPFGDA